MKTIGIIGGMSWKSSLEYYTLINELVQKKLGGFHSCKSIMYSVDFSEIEELQRRGEWDKLTEKMVLIAKHLEDAGADFLVIASNTIHKVAEEIEYHISIPFLHIVDATGEEISKIGLKKVGLLGTNFTMEETFYRGRLLEKYDIKTIIPAKQEREMLQHIIFNELTHGFINEISKRKLKRMIEQLMVQGAEGVILGCTELPLLIDSKESTSLLFNTTELHSKAAVEFVLKEELPTKKTNKDFSYKE